MKQTTVQRAAKVTARLLAVWLAVHAPLITCAVEIVTVSAPVVSQERECGFRCTAGNCISTEQLCDGLIDCPDKADETSDICKILNVTCPEYAAQCDYGACMDTDTRCNGRKECADGSDEENCPTSSPECSFRCTSGDCINEDQVCDGVVHCPDSSDETKERCMNNTSSCPEYAVLCDYGGCVDADARCNGKVDCADGSDEKECPVPSATENCREQEFQCKNGSCISITEVCDGHQHCSDGSDEVQGQCNSTVCPEYTFKCAYGACIDGDKRCDGKAQCADGSDEQPELCATTPGPTSHPCLLPAELKNGKYSINNKTLKYSCNSGFNLLGVETSFCEEGAWSSKPPLCKKDADSGSSTHFAGSIIIAVCLWSTLLIGIPSNNYLP